MARPRHRGDPTAFLVAIGRRFRERADPSAARITQRGPLRLLGILLHDLLRQLAVHTGYPQRAPDPCRAIAAPQHRIRSDDGEATVVDEALIGETANEQLNLGLSRSLPATFSKLACQISGQPGTRRRVTRDIIERRAFESFGIKRRTGFAR